MASSDDFLRLFDPDPVRASEKYNQLFRRLVRFFEWRRCNEPEDLAQDTIGRGLSKIFSVDLHVEPAHYFFGIARLVVMEDRKRAVRRNRFVPLIENVTSDVEQFEADDDEGEHQDALHEIPNPTFDVSLAHTHDEAVHLFQKTLRRLPSRDAKLLMRYLNAKDRVALARQLKLSAGHLRVKFHRIKTQLVQLIRQT
jgi:DNA-directed RNA polymerase specialized sigma24 family protein